MAVASRVSVVTPLVVGIARVRMAPTRVTAKQVATKSAKMAAGIRSLASTKHVAPIARVAMVRMPGVVSHRSQSQSQQKKDLSPGAVLRMGVPMAAEGQSFDTSQLAARIVRVKTVRITKIATSAMRSLEKA
mmetsp:Transcript_52948/g.95212  ORF Transcript_52948/g.95212 Transcript_52948/m.95212 type:complete len:132 (-) Transcript_52948:254-649(-)